MWLELHTLIGHKWQIFTAKNIIKVWFKKTGNIKKRTKKKVPQIMFCLPTLWLLVMNSLPIVFYKVEISLWLILKEHFAIINSYIYGTSPIKILRLPFPFVYAPLDLHTRCKHWTPKGICSLVVAGSNFN